MEFAQPWALAVAAAIIPVALLAFLVRRRGVSIPSAAGILRLRATWRLRLARVRPLLRLAAIALFAVALAGPRIGDANAVVKGEGIDIALSLDISSSMTTSQLGKESRLEASKQVIRDFIKGRENDRIGLVVFQRDALALSPPTLDYRALDKVVDDTDSGLLADGTGIGVGLATALNMLRESTAASRIVILLTDGEQNAPSLTPEDAAELAVALRIKVYTIGVLDSGNRGVDEKRLRAISEETGGRYFSADNPQALADVYEEIGDLEKTNVGRDRFEQFTELVPWFALPAALLLLADLVLGATWLRRTPA